ncbi:MAG: ABC transporter ATP-binding protein [Candidatus Omnitrophica bacterium]|nr:ABC transporter ATP-binding protein [Candidatus Omnitrophota bacterium]
MTQPALRLQGISKQFWVAHEKPALIRELVPRFLHPVRREVVWALRDVTLELPAGVALGVVGPNGSGKTTLLSVLAGITRPTNGTMHVHGSVAPLLTLGSGFHPELTGLENVFLNGSLLGMTTRQIRQRLDAIVEFSQLHRFIDAPLQTYSSGMQLRLGFSIAIHAGCDILVIDEVMLVGDLAFQARCLEQLLAFKRAGKTLVIAAQEASALRPLVDRALLLDQGRIIADGTVDHVRERYSVLAQRLASVHEPLSSIAQLAIQEQVDRHDPSDVRQGWGEQYGRAEVQVEAVRLLDGEGRAVSAVESMAAMTVLVRFTTGDALIDPHIGVAIFREDGTYCYGPNTRMAGLQFHRLEPGMYECRMHLETVSLLAGAYRLSVAVWDAMERAPYVYHIAGYPFVVLGPRTDGVVVLEHLWRQMRNVDGSGSPSLRAEGPRGAQEWFRMFEPLTFTAMLPSPAASGLLTLRAECRGPHDQLWWVSRWSPHPHVPSSAEEPQCHQLVFPCLSLLTGRYHWAIGWESGDGTRVPQMSASCTVDVIADRLDHGIVYLPHHWEVIACQNQPQPKRLSRSLV